MTMWKPDLTRYGGHPAEALAEAIADAIGSGALPAGTRMPTHRELAYDLGLAVATVSKAYGIVARRNLVSGEVGRGTFVASGPRLPTLANSDTEPGNTIDLRICMTPAVGQDVVLAATIEDVMRAGGTRAMLRYPPPGGSPQQRAAAAQWMERVVPGVAPADIVLTSGAHQAIAVAFATLAGPGATVLCDPLTYAGAAQLAAVMGIHLKAVAIDDAGMVPEALDEAIVRHAPKAVFIVPTFQNPMAFTIPAARREALAEIVAHHNIFIIEDAVYADVLDDPPAPFAALEPERTILIASLSKSVCSGLRVGFMRLPHDMTPRAEHHLQSLVLANPPLMAEVGAQLILSGRADDLRHKVAAEIESRYRIARGALGSAGFVGGPQCPHIWVPLADTNRMSEVAGALARQGYWVATARDFAVARDAFPPGLRIALGATPHRHKIADVCQALRQMLTTPMPALSGVV
ncbi:MAG: PLP-dependent aminotransferase family protein [Rhodospirillaceae bacterium]|nr:PLP-dependent aminotransferase family protein [Rhodospirillaceae bacterium]